MKRIRDAAQIISMLEDGQLVCDLSNEISHVLDTLRDVAGPKSKAKGSVTLTLNLSVEGVSAEIEAAIASKTPKVKRQRSFYFVTDEGLSTEHPKQLSMGLEDVSKRRTAAE
jgi:hypothetical protein